MWLHLCPPIPEIISDWLVFSILAFWRSRRGRIKRKQKDWRGIMHRGKLILDWLEYVSQGTLLCLTPLFNPALPPCIWGSQYSNRVELVYFTKKKVRGHLKWGLSQFQVLFKLCTLLLCHSFAFPTSLLMKPCSSVPWLPQSCSSCFLPLTWHKNQYELISRQGVLVPPS